MIATIWLGWVTLRLWKAGENQIGVAFPLTTPAPPFPEGPASSTAVLGVGKELNLTVFLASSLTEQNLTHLADGRLAIHIIGRVDYQDIFGSDRLTTFSMFYGGRYGVNKNGVLVNGPDGNEAT